MLPVEQLARGIFAIGPLSLGVVALGHLATGVRWGAGMVDVGGTSGGLLVLAPFGKGSFSSIRRLRPELLPVTRSGDGTFSHSSPCAPCGWSRWPSLAHEVTRNGGILKDPTVVPTTVSGPKVLR